MTPADSPPQPPPSDSTKLRFVVTAVIALAIVVPIAVILILLNAANRRPSPPAAQPQPASQPAVPPPATRPASAPARPKPLLPTPTISTRPGRRQPETRLDATVSDLKTSVFAFNPQTPDPQLPGLLPAPPHGLYLSLTLQITCRPPSPITLHLTPDASPENSITLVAEDATRIPALGRPRPTFDWIRPFDTDPAQLTSRSPSLDTSAVFLVPETLRSADLRIADQPCGTLQIPPPDGSTGEQSPAGTWVKASRQTWALRYQNPILDAIRADHHTKLKITARHAQLQFDFPLADVTGTAKPTSSTSPNYYDLLLRSADHRHTALARFEKAANVLILYFNDPAGGACVYLRP